MTDIIKSSEGHPFTKPAIIIRNQGIEMIFEECINLWMTMFPDEVEAFKVDMKVHKEMKFKENAMTAGGNFMCKGLIPPKLRKAIAIVLESQDVLDAKGAQHWEKNIELVNAFFNLFKLGCVNETSDLR
jgi:hypothetical protein